MKLEDELQTEKWINDHWENIKKHHIIINIKIEKS